VLAVSFGYGLFGVAGASVITPRLRRPQDRECQIPHAIALRRVRLWTARGTEMSRSDPLLPAVSTA